MRTVVAIVFILSVRASAYGSCSEGRQDYETKSGKTVCLKNEIVDFITCLEELGGGVKIKSYESQKSPNTLGAKVNVGGFSANFDFNRESYKDFVRNIEKEPGSDVIAGCIKNSAASEEGPKRVKAEKQKTSVSAKGASNTKETDDQSIDFDVTAQCPDDFPNLVRCQDWVALGNTAGEDPFTMASGDRARQRIDRKNNQCVCEAHHDRKKSGGPGHWIRCSVTAICSQ